MVKGVQGRKQFLNGRKRILDAFDAARTESKAHEIEVHHGRIAEAQFRRWLKGFLPKRYGITPGFIVSQGTETERLPHFDVVIYDQLESPVLWIEENPDASPDGASRAIPAEYVRGVIEVKSSFSYSNVTSGLDHLQDLDPLLAAIDVAGERYPQYLPPSFFRSVVFVELRAANCGEMGALKQFLRTVTGRGYCPSLVIRGEGLPEDYSGRIGTLRSGNTPPAKFGPLGHNLLQGYVVSEAEFMFDNYFGVQLNYSQNEFSQYAFDILALLRGTYQPGRLSSFHASSHVEPIPSDVQQE